MHFLKKLTPLISSVAIPFILLSQVYAQTTQPVAPVKPVVQKYFGTEVSDNYRYLEELKNPEVQTWMKQQAAFTRAKLDSISGRDSLLKRIHELSNADLVRGGFVRTGNRFFYLLREPGAQQPKLFYRDGLTGAEKLLIDPTVLGEGTKTHYSLDFFHPSGDGKYVAYGISAGGSENSTTYILEVANNKKLEERIDRTEGNQIAWLADNKSFFYLRYAKITPDTPPKEMMYNARSYLHVIGQHTNGDGDSVVFGKGVSKRTDVPEGQATYILADGSSKYAVGVANHNMDANPSTFYSAALSSVKNSNTPWKKWADVSDGITQVELRGDKLYFLSQKNAPKFQLLVTSAAHPDINHASVVVPQTKGVIKNFSIAKEGIYVRSLNGATSNLSLVSFDGKSSKSIKLPFDGAVSGLTTDPKESGVIFTLQSWVQTPRVFAYDFVTDKTVATDLRPESKVDTSSFESKEVYATGYDGTLIPLSIIYKKGIQLDGNHPTVLDGYGSYGISLEPTFNATRLAWLERGGVLAISHIRGGGELGDDWHNAGKMATKLNTIFDFISCVQFLVDQHYTSPQYLAASGRSAGGITVGGAMTLRPELFSVILDGVGLSDTLRFETEPNGPPNVLELGSVENEAGFHSLYAMGAYHHIRDGVAYPSVIYYTGANDPRVAPWHMLKMTARTQAATSSKNPVLLRIDFDAGHGMGSNVSQREVELADLWSFALWRMGDAEFNLKQ